MTAQKGEFGEVFPQAVETQTGPRQTTDLLLEQNKLLDAAVKARLQEKIAGVSAEALPASLDYFSVDFNARIGSILSDAGLDPSLIVVAPPANKKHDVTKGVDVAFNSAGVAKKTGQNPVETAKNLAQAVGNQQDVLLVETVGPFVNIGIDFKAAGPRILSEVAHYKDKFGHFRDSEPQLVIIDYSSPNVAKNMTLAHLRSTIIGHSLSKIQRAAGNIPFSVNHIGDWGTQFGSIIYEYQKELAERGDEFKAELEANPTATLMRIYRAFNDRKNDDPATVSASREIFLALEKGDPELVRLWDQFREWSLQDFGPAYDRLRVNFDAIQGESFYEDRMAPAIDDAVSRGVLASNREGAVVFPSQPLTDPTNGSVNQSMMLDQKGKPRDEVVLKPSGGTVYLTRDLAAIRYRGQELQADKVLYVIGKEQQAHCMVLFAMADQLDYMPMGNAEHISFGHLNIDGRKMKSREGRVVLLSEVLDEAIAAAGELLLSFKHKRGDRSELTEEEWEIARKIGTSALIFNDLRQDRQKDIEFVPDMAQNIEEGGSTYIQYAHSRLNSLLEKVDDIPEEVPEIPDNLSDEEKLLLLKISRLPMVIKEAAEFNAPHKIATFLTSFCQTINAFYRDSSVVNADTEVEKRFRVSLVRASRQVIENASELLHIELPGRM